MATIKIEPIEVTTIGGHEARLTGIDPTNTDCIAGEILPATHPLSQVRWDLLGRARDNHTDCNLDMQTDEMKALVALARKLGAGDA